MPPKPTPRRRQPARGSRSAPEDESVETLPPPSAKQALAKKNDGAQDASRESIPQHNAPESSGVLEVPTSLEIHSRSRAQSPTPTLGSSPPARRQVEHLASALPRNPSALSAAAASENRSGLKFKPKFIIRRSKEDREAFERAETDRLTERRAEEGGSARDRGGHYGRGRGRDGGMQDMNRWKNERFNARREASGHLGGATIRERPARGRGRGGGRGGGVGPVRDEVVVVDDEAAEPAESMLAKSRRRVKKEQAVKPEKDKDGNVVMTSSNSKTKPKRTKIKKEDQAPIYVSSEGEFDSDGGKKRNIEEINLVTSSEDEEDAQQRKSDISKDKQPEREAQIPVDTLRPVRIQRQEHVERAVGVNTDASSLTAAELRRRAKERAEAGGSLFMSEDEAEVGATPKTISRRKPKDVEFLRNERRWKGVYQDEDERDRPMSVKQEPKDDDDAMIIDTETPMPVVSQEPRPEAMAVDFEDGGVPLRTAIDEQIPDAAETQKIIADVENAGKAAEEEILPQPDERQQQAFGYLYRKRRLTVEQRDALQAEMDELFLSEDDMTPTLTNSTPAQASQEDKADLPFSETGCHIFQLPPLIPSLRDRNKRVLIPNPSTRKPSKSKSPKPISSTSTNPFIVTPKQEEDGGGEEEDILDTKHSPSLLHPASHPHTYTARTIALPPGLAGTLTVHADGRMRASWGGLGLEVHSVGSEGGVNQEVVLTAWERAVVKVEGEERWEERVGVGKRAWAMGRTEGGAGWFCMPDLGGLGL